MSRPAATPDISPTPTDEEVVAINAALEWLWPRPVVILNASNRSAVATAWRFSGRWWNNHPLTSRPRP